MDFAPSVNGGDHSQAQIDQTD